MFKNSTEPAERGLNVINQMIERQPSFAREIGQILEIRRRAIAAIKKNNGRVNA